MWCSRHQGSMCTLSFRFPSVVLDVILTARLCRFQFSAVGNYAPPAAVLDHYDEDRVAVVGKPLDPVLLALLGPTQS
jgi:hypothetical protein